MSNPFVKDKLAIFIDGANIHATAKALGYSVDYCKFIRHFSQRYSLVRAYYYTAMLPTTQHNPLVPLVDFLESNGFTVKQKPAKEFRDHATGTVLVKGNMDAEICVDMMKAANTGRLDRIFLFSGDGDFRSLVEAVQDMGIRVTVFSTKETKPPMLAHELRKQSDEFIDMAGEFKEVIRDERYNSF